MCKIQAQGKYTTGLNSVSPTSHPLMNGLVAQQSQPLEYYLESPWISNHDTEDVGLTSPDELNTAFCDSDDVGDDNQGFQQPPFFPSTEITSPFDFETDFEELKYSAPLSPQMPTNLPAASHSSPSSPSSPSFPSFPFSIPTFSPPLPLPLEEDPFTPSTSTPTSTFSSADEKKGSRSTTLSKPSIMAARLGLPGDLSFHEVKPQKKATSKKAGVSPKSPEVKMVEKREKNRLASEKYRKRCRDLTSVLDQRCHELTLENEELNFRNKSLEQEVQFLTEILKNFKSSAPNYIPGVNAIS